MSQDEKNFYEEDDDSGQNAEQFISFTIDSEEYGINIMDIREIKGWSPVTPLPNVPNHVRGVINLRGAVVPVFDLRTRFSGVVTKPSAHHVVMVVSIGGRIVGTLVDAVADILAVENNSIKPIPLNEFRQDAQFLSGLINIDDRMVALLDLKKLLADDLDVQGAA